MLETLFGWRKASKCKELIKSIRCRLKLLRSKRDTIVRQLREDVVQLLKNGQDESALTWVEQLFKNQNILAAYDLLDDCCEFIILNLPYIRRHRDFPNDLNEAVSSLIFAATLCVDLPELQLLRKLFGERYGNDFVVAAVELCPGNHVNQKISENLRVRTISYDAKLKLVAEIAKAHNLQLGCQDIEDGCKLQQQQVHFNKGSVYNPSVKGSDCDLEKQFSERIIQVSFGDIRGDQVRSSNDKEKLHNYQQRHLGLTKLLQEKPRSDFLLHRKKTVPSTCQSHEGSDIISSIDVSDVCKCASYILQPLNSTTIHTSMQEVEKLNKLDPSYEKTIVSPDEAEDILFSMLAYDEDNDERWLASTNSLPSNKCRLPYEEKHIPQSRLNRSKNKIGVSGSHGEGNHENSYIIYCKSPSRASRASLSGLHHFNCSEMIKKFGEMDDGSVSYWDFSKRRKSERTRSRKRESHVECPYRHELGHLCRIHGTPYRKIHQQRDYSMSMATSVKDVEYAMYYDESCRDPDVNFMKLNHKIGQDHHHHHYILNLADGLHMNKMSRNRRKHSLECYYAHKTWGDDISCTSHGCRGQSCNSCSWKYDTVHDCCLEHPCYFFASDDKIDWVSPSLKRSCVTTLTGPFCSIQLQEQTDPCYPHNHEFNRIKTIYRRATRTHVATEDAMCERPCMDLNSNIIPSQSLRSHSDKEALKEASNCSDESNGSSSISYSNENLPASSGSWTKTHPPYSRVMTNKTPHSASFLFQQPNCHVHPKLPDYDDLAAKFTALKKEHLQSKRSSG
ncbi:hypothetical protein AAC387_Pa07g1001 [Persea americana]